MVRNVAGEMATLEDEDFYLLSGVEQGMRFSEWVRRDKIPEYATLTPEEVDYRIDRCLDRELIQRKTIQYVGYQLTFGGYDALALRTFAERETVEGVGSPLGLGKEGDVYEARSFKPVALKYHREGYTNFREVARGREYTADHNHVSWMYTARKAAEREYQVIEDLYPNVAVPRPIDHNRHAIVMDKFPGVELARAKLDPEQAVPVLDLIVRELTKAYHRGWVHADASEHNVAVAESGITVFDWPQAVPTDHENARELLERDLRNLVRYFRRKYPHELGKVDIVALANTVVGNEFESVAAHLTD